ncbi:MAG: DNA polymerase domain-containing protein [Actinobacteria bacterium]|nr:DNA polymerase domain-containing protein [Actinomycetota bacterium]
MASPSIELAVPGPDGPRAVRISNPDRVYFPQLGLTKRDIAEYYLAVGDGVVAALWERPCMLRRFPEGIGGEQIYQKRLPKGAPDWVQTARVAFPSGRHADELCVTEPASVIWAVQMSTIEFHPWHSRRADTERPDELRIDLDPQPGTSYEDARRVALAVRELLAELGVPGWPKTSGSRGIHIFVRIEPRWGFTEVRRAALALARELERRMPDLVTSRWWKEERGPRVFADYNQNARDRTMACAYSIRARPTAPVSTPLTWDEVPDADPEELTVRTVPERFARLGDVWSGINEAAWSIEPLLEWAARDERDRGQGDAPYPPHFPKMEGEPMRVSPSRAKPPTSMDGAPPISGPASKP